MRGVSWLPLLFFLVLLVLLPLVFGQLFTAALIKLKLDPMTALLVVIGILLGSPINIPLKRMAREESVLADPLAVLGLQGWWPSLQRVRRETIIAVNVGTPLLEEREITSAVMVANQMLQILTEQNVQRSLASLRPSVDLLIAPALGALSSADFGRSRELVARGREAAHALLPQLRELALPPDRWLALLSRRQVPAPPAAPIASLRFEGADVSQPQQQVPALASRPGEPLDIDRVEADTRALSATGDYLHADYRLEDLPAGTGLVFSLVEKPWGPDYFRLGLEMASDFAGRGDFNLKLGHNRHWLTASGTEWRNRAQIGSVPRWFSEVHQPLGDVGAGGVRTFVSLHGDLERRRLDVYRAIGPEQDGKDAVLQARHARSAARIGLDLGQALGSLGEVRIGLTSLRDLTVAELTRDAGLASDPMRERTRERGLRAALLIDQLDHVSFPRSGHRLRLSVESGRRRLAPDVGAPGEELVDGGHEEEGGDAVAADGLQRRGGVVLGGGLDCVFPFDFCAHRNSSQKMVGKLHLGICQFEFIRWKNTGIKKHIYCFEPKLYQNFNIYFGPVKLLSYPLNQILSD